MMKPFYCLFSSCLSLLLVLIAAPPTANADGGSVDTMFLTDEPGNWFKSQTTGTPFTAINAGQRVDFKINNCCTSTRHTVTLLMKPTGSRVALDQDDSQNGTLSAAFDVPGVYLFHCKVHPYMTAVGRREERGWTNPRRYSGHASIYWASWRKLAPRNDGSFSDHDDRAD
jgi:plastocyanin